MTLILAHIICAICSFLLAKLWLEKVSRPYGGIIKTWRKEHENDPETSNEEYEDIPRIIWVDVEHGGVSSFDMFPVEEIYEFNGCEGYWFSQQPVQPLSWM